MNNPGVIREQCYKKFTIVIYCHSKVILSFCAIKLHYITLKTYSELIFLLKWFMLSGGQSGTNVEVSRKNVQ